MSALLLLALATNTLRAAPTREATAKQAVAQDSILPSRYVTPEEMPKYIATISANFSMDGRKYDPFGQVQNPDAQVPAARVVHKRASYHPLKPTSFADIIKRIKVTTIMPAEGRFLVGTRSFSKGERFPLDFRSKQIEVEITAVNSDKIEFENVATGEVASVSLNLLPQGMKRGEGGIQAPGIVPDQKNAPLQIDTSR